MSRELSAYPVLRRFLHSDGSVAPLLWLTLIALVLAGFAAGFTARAGRHTGVAAAAAPPLATPASGDLLPAPEEAVLARTVAVPPLRPAPARHRRHHHRRSASSARVVAAPAPTATATPTPTSTPDAVPVSTPVAVATPAPVVVRPAPVHQPAPRPTPAPQGPIFDSSG